jgi:hypothetical protein
VRVCMCVCVCVCVGVGACARLCMEMCNCQHLLPALCGQEGLLKQVCWRGVDNVCALWICLGCLGQYTRPTWQQYVFFTLLSASLPCLEICPPPGCPLPIANVPELSLETTS